MSPVQTDPRLHHECILASAGSGKTFRLSSRFIELIDAGETPQRILASTFTRLAAGEIRDRILMRVANAVLDPAKREELATSINHHDLSAERAGELLRLLTGKLHKLQVRTLDSFFAAIVQSFALDLGLPAPIDIADEQLDIRLRRQAVGQMLDERDPQPLIDLLRVLTEGDSSRLVTDSIDDTVAGMYGLFRESEAAAWHWMKPRPLLSRAELQQAIERLELNAPTIDKRHLKSHGADLERARACGHSDADGWSAFLAKGLASKVAGANGPPVFYKKTIEPNVVEAYTPVVEHARAVLWNHVVYRTSSTFDLLARFDRQYRSLKQDHASLTFDDVTERIAEAESSLSFAEICFRIDAAVHHLLLDEFQDTSVMQWRALAPIAAEVVSDGSGQRTFFCVGDVKQSIYGWRDATPELLRWMPELLAGPDGRETIRVESLTASYRSSPIVIEAVNDVFLSLHGNEALRDLGEATAFWEESYERHTTVREHLEGYVELRMVDTEPQSRRDVGPRLVEAARLVAKLYRADPNREIGVLLRTNRNVSRLLYELGPTRCNVPAAGRGGASLTDAAAVCAVLDLLRMADHPDHTVAAFNVMRSPLGPVVGLADDQPIARARRRRWRVARQVREMLMDRGYAASIQEWMTRITSVVDPRELRRLQQLVDLADEFDQRPGLRPADFVELAQSRRIDDPATSKVRVMNLHQAKGLEFDIVVLPDLEASIGASRGQAVAVERDGVAGPVSRVVRWVHQSFREALPELKPLFDEQINRIARDDLCVLYVAMTRAKRGLFMLIDPPPPNERSIPKTFAGVLRTALGEGDEGPGQMLYARGQRSWIDRPDHEVHASITTGTEQEPREQIRLAAPAGRIRLAASPSASAHAGRAVETALHISDGLATDRGLVIHAMFEQVEWLEDFHPDPAALQALAQRIAPRHGDFWAGRQVNGFLTMHQRDAVRDALSLGSMPRDAVRVWRERPFARIVRGELQKGVIDRLVVHVKDSAPQSATIIDYKTDGIDEDEALLHGERYRMQLDAYRAAASELLDLDESQIQQVLLFVTPGVAIDLADRRPT